MKKIEADGFDSVIAESAENVQNIKIGGVTYRINPAGSRVDDTAIFDAFKHYKTDLVTAENDKDEFKSDDKEDHKQTLMLARGYGYRFQTMRDYRVFFTAIKHTPEFRCIKGILNEDGTEYADTPDKVSKVLRAFEARPTLFDQINDLAGWPEFDAKKKAKAAAAESAAAKGGPKIVKEGEESPNA